MPHNHDIQKGRPVGSHSSGPPAGGTLPIQVNTTQLSLCKRLLLTILNRKIYTALTGLIKGDVAMREKQCWTLTIKVYHACFENAPQAVLQLYVIIITWGSIKEHAYQDPLIIRNMTMTEDLNPSNEQLGLDCLRDVWEGEQNK